MTAATISTERHMPRTVVTNAGTAYVVCDDCQWREGPFYDSGPAVREVIAHREAMSSFRYHAAPASRGPA